MSARHKSAPFSTHARGVPLFDRVRFLDVSKHATRALLDLRDIGSSMFWFFSMQSWLTLWSTIVNIVSVTFFCYYGVPNFTLGAPMDLTMVGFAVVLPLVGFIWIAYCRRERCLALLSEIKTRMLTILRAHAEWAGASNSIALDPPSARVHAPLAAIVTAMHGYFFPARFYSRSYPYLGYKTAMIQIALDRSRTQRTIRDAISALDSAATTLRSDGLPTPLEAMLHETVFRLQLAIDQLSNVKEFGTPQGIRSMSRFYVCLIIPLVFAPYWALVAEASNFAVAFFGSLAVQIALVGILNVALSLEDPFDNSGMDGIFIDEQLYDVEQALLACGADPSLLGMQAGNGTGGEGAAPNGRTMNAAGQTTPSRVVRVKTDTV